MNIASWLGLLAILVAALSYSFYFRDMFRGKTKPHGFTWLIWGLLNSFIFLQQVNYDAGPGAWVTGIAAVANLLIFILSFKYGERSLTKLDWFCLTSALLILIYWYLVSDAELAVFLACTVFAIGFAPTIRKAWSHASEETIATYALNGTKFLIALFALNQFTVVTALYPSVLMILNIGFAVLLLVRRKR